jgi:hypothetical protein
MLFGDWVTLDTATRALGVSYVSLYKRIKREHIPVQKAGRTIMVRLQDVQPKPQKDAASK